MAKKAHREIALQKTIDRKWSDHQNALMARMAAVVRAQEAVARRERGAGYELRAALVDLAAAAQVVAEAMPTPGA